MYLSPPRMHSSSLDNVLHRSFPLFADRFNVAEIDTKSIQFAIENVRTNNLQSRINILPTVNESPLLPLNCFQIER